jgi:hypothetical protein
MSFAVISAMVSRGDPLTPAERELWDQNKLCSALHILGDVPRAKMLNNEMYLALNQAGITRFDDQFVHITTNEINLLEYDDPASHTHKQLSMASKMKLRAILAYYHNKSFTNGGPISILGATKADYTEFRATRYDPNKAIRPWGVMSTSDEALQEWNKKV